MLKFQVLSDLHLDHHQDGGIQLIKSLKPSKDTDLLVIAGDLCQFFNKTILKEGLKRLEEKYPYILYVWGNHEFFNRDTKASDLVLMAEELKTTQTSVFAREGLCSIKGHLFVAGPMWYPYVDSAQPWTRNMADFHCIAEFVPWVYDEHERFLKLLNQDLFSSNIVVVTHHAPSYQSVGEFYKGSPLNPFFANNLEPLISRKKPNLWIHGHMHTPCEYQLDQTKVICNPYGYPGENRKINKNLCISL